MYLLPVPFPSSEMRFDVDEQSNLAWSGQSRLEINSEVHSCNTVASFGRS